MRRRTTRDRREYLHALDTFGKAINGLPEFTDAERTAYELILGDAGKVFDLNQEKPELRDRYGRHTFGQSCLVARGLVERRVAWSTINCQGGWDTHRQVSPKAAYIYPAGARVGTTVGLVPPLQAPLERDMFHRGRRRPAARRTGVHLPPPHPTRRL